MTIDENSNSSHKPTTTQICGRKRCKEIQIGSGPTGPVKCLPTKPPRRGRSESSESPPFHHPQKKARNPQRKEQQQQRKFFPPHLHRACPPGSKPLGFRIRLPPRTTSSPRLPPPRARAGSHQTLGRQIRCDRPRWRPRRRPRGAAQGSGQGSGTSPAPPPGGWTGGWSWEPAAPSWRRPSATSSRKASATSASRTSATPATATVSSRSAYTPADTSS